MSDAGDTTNAKPEGNERYVSQIDDLFAQAWNDVHNSQDGSDAGEGEDKGNAAAAGDGGGALQGEGAGAAAGAGTAEDVGALPTAGDQPGAESGGGEGDDGKSASADAAAGATDGDQSAAQGVAAEGLELSVVTPLWAPAREEAFKRMDQSFRQAAIQQLQEEINPEFITSLQSTPSELVGQEVLSIRAGAPADEKVVLRTRADAAEYLQDLNGIVQKEINGITAERRDAARPIATVIQESFLLFENNPDLIPGTKGYDHELASRFAEIASTYEVKINGKVIGYQDINVQPLINSLRKDLEKQRGANGVTAAQQRAEQQRQAAAAQERNTAGQFQGPQGGVLSKSGNQGDAAEDFSAFWSASGVQAPGTLGI
ncbi:hypothetical protein SEA_PABST_49 [Microbacterium phage Pabst]|nr:hypothetical protein SEA_PABST_49 [Microbacterium phage Pabst]